MLLLSKHENKCIAQGIPVRSIVDNSAYCTGDNSAQYRKTVHCKGDKSVFYVFLQITNFQTINPIQIIGFELYPI